ncbi:hypothetical protein MKW94_009260 [Papaver nudicaule]|uniref:GPN-loop GTPase n=1 Tax=Papaver nudicaule TaxID=74823 RepID=A0AA41VQE4_PAPNU|nr:hypothetical protein [Papaver nudicaule]
MEIDSESKPVKEEPVMMQTESLSNNTQSNKGGESEDILLYTMGKLAIDKTVTYHHCKWQHEFALEWMIDFEVLQAALDSDHSYTSTLTRSLSLVLDEFYNNLRFVGVSAVTGAGMDAFFKTVDASADEFMETYKLEEERRRQSMDKLRKDMENSGGESVLLSTGLKNKPSTSKSMMDEDEDWEDDIEDDFGTITHDEEIGDDDDGEEVANFNF